MITLTPREQQVLQAVVDGGGHLETAADKLGLSVNTVRVHMTNCANKLGTRGQGRLATILAARRANVIQMD